MHPWTSNHVRESVAASPLAEAVLPLRCKLISPSMHRLRVRLTQAVEAYALPFREMEHLSLNSEVVSFFGPTQDALAWRADHLNPQVVQLEKVVLDR
jgi:hypothetical protein